MAPGERGAQIRDYFISLEEIAHAALQVADAVSRGDIAPPTPLTETGRKRLREFEDTVDRTRRKLDSFGGEFKGEERRLSAIHARIQSRERARDEEIKAETDRIRREADADILAMNEECAPHVERLVLIDKEKSRLRALLKRVQSEMKPLQEAAARTQADFDAMQAELLAEMRERQRAWLSDQQSSGRVLTTEMENFLENTSA